jgi:hypothetical protein
MAALALTISASGARAGFVGMREDRQAVEGPRHGDDADSSLAKGQGQADGRRGLLRILEACRPMEMP